LSKKSLKEFYSRKKEEKFEIIYEKWKIKDKSLRDQLHVYWVILRLMKYGFLSIKKEKFNTNIRKLEIFNIWNVPPIWWRMIYCWYSVVQAILYKIRQIFGPSLYDTGRSKKILFLFRFHHQFNLVWESVLASSGFSLILITVAGDLTLILLIKFNINYHWTN
jgi:hypothetical protein